MLRSGLSALVAAAELEGFFIFVGASGGGYLATEMAVRNPNETAGLVLVETAKAIEGIPPTSHRCCRATHRPTWSDATTWLWNTRCRTTSTRSVSSSW